jgi:hypothetical protein
MKVIFCRLGIHKWDKYRFFGAWYENCVWCGRERMAKEEK